MRAITTTAISLLPTRQATTRMAIVRHTRYARGANCASCPLATCKRPQGPGATHEGVLILIQLLSRLTSRS
eukprot:scaffold49878_cov40-Tisochrysis_lutea.AAC.3